MSVHVERNSSAFALLLQVGIDKQSVGTYGPIFEDGSFEYIPVPAKSTAVHFVTYNQRQGRKRLPLSVYLPRNLKNAPLRDNPEFETPSFSGGPSLSVYLRALQRGDLLVFYAGLQPFHTDTYGIGLYVIGYFTVKDIVVLDDLSQTKVQKFGERIAYDPDGNSSDMRDLVLVIGDKAQSKRLDGAILLAKPPASQGRGSGAAFAFSDEMVELIGVSRTIENNAGPICVAGEDHMTNLKRMLGLREGG